MGQGATELHPDAGLGPGVRALVIPLFILFLISLTIFFTKIAKVCDLINKILIISRSPSEKKHLASFLGNQENLTTSIRNNVAKTQMKSYSKLNSNIIAPCK